MAIKAAINGFGRIGRLVLRAAKEMGRDDFEIVAINDLGEPEMNAHLLRRDTVHGAYPGKVELRDGEMDVGLGKPLRVLREKDPTKLPWREMGIDIVFECSGVFRTRKDAAKHLEAGARKVLISAPAKGEGADLTVVYGVNHQDLKADHKVVSNASCTTNCIAPVAMVMHQAVGIEHGYMVTAHGYTASQNIVDGLHKDPRRARAAAANMIPTSTGAAEAVGLVLPELDGRITGTALRVPLPNVSIVYFTFQAGRDTDVESLHQAARQAAQGNLQGVLSVAEEELVSSDYNHNPFSAILDPAGTKVSGRLCTVMAWYDNEWAFSIRMLDTGKVMAQM